MSGLVDAKIKYRQACRAETYALEYLAELKAERPSSVIELLRNATSQMKAAMALSEAIRQTMMAWRKVEKAEEEATHEGHVALCL